MGIYQVGTVKDAELLYGCVSNRARQAIGLGDGTQCGTIHEGQKLRGCLLLGNQPVVELPAGLGQSSMTVSSRQRVSLKDVVWDPPEINLRSVVR